MNYTEKYHLPQWKKEDRVMMEDFNRMCQDMEAGLDKTARDAAVESARLRTDSEAADKLAFDRLYRLTYNHYRAAQSVEPFPRQMGAFYQDYSQSGNVARMLRIGNFLWTGGNQTALTQAELLGTTSQPTHITMESDTCTLLFTPPKSAWLETIHMTSLYGSTAAEDRAGTLRLYDTTEDRIVAEHSIKFSVKATSSGTSLFDFPVGCSIAAGHGYRLEIYMNRTNFIKCDFYVPTSGSPFGMKSVGGGEPAPFTYRFQEDVGSSGGLFLVHYVPSGTDNGLILTWDGEEYTPTRVRTAVTSQGDTVREAEFWIERQVPADSTVSLRLDCGGGRRAFCFYDWGGILLG